MTIYYFLYKNIIHLIIILQYQAIFYGIFVVKQIYYLFLIESKLLMPIKVFKLFETNIFYVLYFL